MKKIVIGETIKKLRESKSLSQDELGEILKVSGKTISSWEIGRTEPNMGYVQQLGDFFNISTDKLIYGNIKKEINETKVNFMKRTISIYGTIPAGTPYEAIEDIIGEVQIPDYLPSEEKLFALKIDGDSMNMVIPDGYIGVFEKTSELYSGQIGAVYVNGYDATVKKFHNLTDTIVLEPLSYNKEHTPVVIKKDDTDNPVVVLGRLVWACASDDYDFR